MLLWGIKTVRILTKQTGVYGSERENRNKFNRKEQDYVVIPAAEKILSVEKISGLLKIIEQQRNLSNGKHITPCPIC